MWLREREGADRPPLGHARQPLCFLFLRGELPDTGNREVLDRQRGRDREVAVGQLLVDDAVCHLVGLEPAVLLWHREPGQVQLREAVPHVLWELLFLVALVDAGLDLPLDELLDRIAYQLLFGRQFHWCEIVTGGY